MPKENHSPGPVIMGASLYPLHVNLVTGSSTPSEAEISESVRDFYSFFTASPIHLTSVVKISVFNVSCCYFHFLFLATKGC